MPPGQTSVDLFRRRSRKKSGGAHKKRRPASRVLATLATGLLIAAACGGTPPAASPTGAATAAAATATPVATFVPTRASEFVIQTAPGGASDIYARTWIAIMEKEKMVPQPVTPVNKEGGAGAVAFTYLFEKRADPHYVMVTLNSFWTTIITQKLPYKSTDFTPIANLAFDPFFLWVRDDSPIKTAADFVKAAQEREIIVSGTGAKQEDEVLFRRIQDLAKTKAFKYVPQTGGGAVAAALAGNQGGVEVTVNNPSEGKGLFGTKKIRPVCAFVATSPTEGTFKDLVTCKSQGLAIDDYFNVRSVVAAPGLTTAQQTYWVDVFKKVADSSDWKKFVADNALNPDFRAGDDFKKLIEQYETIHREIATKNGWI
jgi:putative tricarboxylic transport membrane protein